MAFKIGPLSAVQKVGCCSVEGSTPSVCSSYVVGSDPMPLVTSRSHSSANFRLDSSKRWKTGVLGGQQVVRHKSVGAGAGTGTIRKGDHGLFCLKASMETPCGDQLRPHRQEGSSVLETWLQRYVTEIVKHLPEAPFMQLVTSDYASGDLKLDADRQKLSVELFEQPQTWGPVKQSLLDSAPDGIILVQRLDQGSLADCCCSCLNDHENCATCTCTCSRKSSSFDDSSHGGASSTDVWGLLVQGFSMQCTGTACYILKTTRVASSNSSGILTHFSVCRAKSCQFGPSLQSQLESTWLL